MNENKKSVVYVDETTLHTWITKKKTWTGRKFPIKIPLPARIGGVTVYGAIGYPLKKPVWHIDVSTSIQGYCDFMRKVSSMMERSKPTMKRGLKPYIIYDGHRAHKNEESSRLMRKHFRLMP